MDILNAVKQFRDATVLWDVSGIIQTEKQKLQFLSTKEAKAGLQREVIRWDSESEKVSSCEWVWLGWRQKQHRCMLGDVPCP